MHRGFRIQSTGLGAIRYLTLVLPVAAFFCFFSEAPAGAQTPSVNVQYPNVSIGDPTFDETELSNQLGQADIDLYSCYPKFVAITVKTLPCDPEGNGEEAKVYFNTGITGPPVLDPILSDGASEGTSEAALVTGCTWERRVDSRTGSVWYVRYGDSGPDECTGWAGLDIFWMKGGDDYAAGVDGNDILHMGDAADEAHGGDNFERIYGGEFTDYMYGGFGHDRIYDNCCQYRGDAIGDGDYAYGGPGHDGANLYDEDENDYFWPGEDKDKYYIYDCSYRGGFSTHVCDGSTENWPH